ncbi:putative uncharacterized protein [Firmicutes bacterium CAG:791]|nr:putative uncharacterized protein [Firmicutes bacterium CAG:791]
MDALEVCISRIVACLAQSLEACLHQSADTAAEDCLLTEQVGLGLGLEGCLKNTCAGSADCSAICKCLVQSMSGCILLYCYQHRSSLACLILGTNSMSGSLGSDHRNVYILRRNDQLVVDVEAMCKHQHIAGLQIRSNILLVHIGLKLIIDQNHDDIGLLYCLCSRKNRKALCLCLCLGLGALIQTNHDITSGILQIQCMCMALRTVADNADLLTLEKRLIAIFLVKNSCFCHFNFLLYEN